MTRFGTDLIESLTDAAAQAKCDPSGVLVHTVTVPDVRAIRHQLGLSQQEFAATYQIPLPTLQNWEQGRRHPDARAAAYLRVIAKRPKETSEALAP